MTEDSTYFFTVPMHQGGYFLGNEYIEGDLAYFDFYEEDKMSLFELHSMAEMVETWDLGFVSRKCLVEMV